MNPKSFNVKIHDEAVSKAKITLAATCGNRDYDKTIGYLDTFNKTVTLSLSVPTIFMSRIASACEDYIGGMVDSNEH